MDSLIIQDVFEPYYAGRGAETRPDAAKPAARAKPQRVPRRPLKAGPLFKKTKKAER